MNTTRCPSTKEVQGNGPFGRPWMHTEQCEHPAGHSGPHEVITDPLPGMRPWTDDTISGHP